MHPRVCSPIRSWSRLLLVLAGLAPSSVTAAEPALLSSPAPAPTPTPTPTPAVASPAKVVATPPTPSPDGLAGTWYRAVLKYDKIGELPFYLHIPERGRDGKAFVINGTETVEFNAEWRENEVSVTGPWNYTSVIEAELDAATHKLRGQWTRDTPLWGAVVRDFEATPIVDTDPQQRFAALGTAPPSISAGGTWKFRFKEHGESEGILEQTPDGVVRGFIKPGQLGDARFLAGNVHGTKLGLSQFNGNSANLVLAELSPDGKTMKGLLSMQNVWNETFTAEKLAGYHFVNKVHLKAGKTSLSLAGLAKYKGKPTLAIIFATWCPSCNDAHPFFKELYTKYHSKGLEVLGVSYELSEDRKANQAQIDSFRKKYDVPWELLQVPCTPETWAKAMPPELENWDGLPIIALIRADGTVYTVFGGWFGPATGAEGERLKVWLEDATKSLLAGGDTQQLRPF